MSPAEKEARQMMADKKLMAASTRAYNQADKTEPAPATERRRRFGDEDSGKFNHAVEGRKLMQAFKPADEPTVDAMGNQTGMKKGGKVKKMSAGGYTRAADGIAQRGKTRGKMC